MKKVHDIDFPNTHWAYIIATWFWVGKLKPASGTWGSLAAIPFGLGILWLTGAIGLIIAIIFLTWFGAKAIEHIESQTNRHRTHDAGCFVVDEVVGQWVTLLILPLLFLGTPPFTVEITWLLTAAAFVTFRFFDIIKLSPAKQIETMMHTGLGVMLDDIIAGLQALISLAFIIKIFY